MAATRVFRGWRKWVLVIGIIAGLILLVPYRVPHMPATSVQVVGEDGNSVTGVHGHWLYHTSTAYSGWQTLSFDERGRTSIPRQLVWTNLLLNALRAVTAGLPHSGWTPYRQAEVHVFVPDTHTLDPVATGLEANPTWESGEPYPAKTWVIPEARISLDAHTSKQQAQVVISIDDPSVPSASFRVVLSKHAPATFPASPER